MPTTTDPTRRRLLRTGAKTSVGLLLAMALPMQAVLAQEVGRVERYYPSKGYGYIRPYASPEGPELKTYGACTLRLNEDVSFERVQDLRKGGQWVADVRGCDPWVAPPPPETKPVPVPVAEPTPLAEPAPVAEPASAETLSDEQLRAMDEAFDSDLITDESKAVDPGATDVADPDADAGNTEAEPDEAEADDSGVESADAEAEDSDEDKES